jgi:hypothetical protein
LAGLSGRIQAPIGASIPDTRARVMPISQASAGDPLRLSTSLFKEANGSLTISVTSPQIAIVKAVFNDGRTSTFVDHAGDRLRIEATRTRVRFERGERGVAVDVGALSDARLVRVRALLGPSAAARVLRRLTAALEAAQADTPDRLAVRLTGGVMLQLDGDEGALDRLSRECAPGGPPLIGPVPPIHTWTGYLSTLGRLAWDFQASVRPLSCWDPARISRALEWAADAEACWYAYLSEASAPATPW